MRYSNDNLLNYTSYYEEDAFNTLTDQVLGGIELGLINFKNVTNIDCITNLEVFSIGSITNNTNVNAKDTIDILLKVNNPFLIENNKIYLKTKNKKKRKTIFSTPNIQNYIADAMVQTFTIVTNIYNSSNIFLESLAELGKNYKIFVTASEGEDSSICTGINPLNNKLYTIDLQKIYDNFEEKNRLTDGFFGNLICIIKNISYDINLNFNSQALESIIFNVPNKYFRGSLNEQLTKVLNYIRLSDYSQFLSIDKSSTIQNNAFYNTSVMDIKQFIDTLSQVLM